MNNNSLPPLSTYILWHQQNLKAIKYTNAIYSAFTRDIKEPLSRGIGIPVYFRSKFDKNNTLLPINLNQYQHTAVILLMDLNLNTSEDWKKYLKDLTQQIIQSKGRHTIYVFITDQNVKIETLIPELKDQNICNLHKEKHPILHLKNETTHELCRLLYSIKQDEAEEAPPIKLFISHAKADGEQLAKKIRCFILNQTILSAFFDKNGIYLSDQFGERIETEIKKPNTALLVIHSDKYSSRPWCRKEIIIAKQNRKPIIILNVLNNGEERSFPYMFNVKTIRLKDGYLETIDSCGLELLSAILHEILKYKYSDLYIKYSLEKFKIPIVREAVFPNAPELMSLLNLDKPIENNVIIYPEPPLGQEETEILKKFNKNLDFITPINLPVC